MLSINDIISNIKKGQSAIATREILSKLEQTYSSIKATIQIVGYKTEASKNTIFLNIPSATTRSVLYDVVIELHTPSKIDLNTKFKVYCNTPAFGYNFAYVFYSYGSLLYPEKYPQEMKQIPPVTRNPFFTVGFDKHMYSSIRLISEIGLTSIRQQYPNAVPPVKSFDDKMQEIKNTRENPNH